MVSKLSFAALGVALSGFLGILLCGEAAAAIYELPDDASGSAILGADQTIQAVYEDTLSDLARRFGLGYEEIVRVNPGVDPWLPGAGTPIVIPGERILPAGPHVGIVVNLPEHRLYYYPKRAKGQKAVVITFPVSVGKMDWRTPMGTTKVVEKIRNPAWYPPASVRLEHAANHDPLPNVVPPGPQNPLGAFAMRLGIPGGSYLIHGTNNPLAVGMAVTHGCLRLYPEDIESLFRVVPVGTPVTLINEPIKIAWVDGKLFIEVHPPVNAEGQSYEPNVDDFAHQLDVVLGSSTAAVNWDIALAELKAARGMPVLVGLEADLTPADAASLTASSAAPAVSGAPAPARATATEAAAPSDDSHAAPTATAATGTASEPPSEPIPGSPAVLGP
jgi:L,D-transpeptidase ErfK/SrfK